jgi:Uma2 family endonuclease
LLIINWEPEVHAMETVEEIQQALARLTVGDRLAVGRWLQELDRAGTKGYRVAEPSAIYAATDPPFMTLEEFFQFEEHSKIHHEYVDGAVFAMSGASVAHERIRHRLLMAFGNHLKGGPCQVFSAGMQLVIRREATEICYYPDVMVDCRRDAWGSHFVRSPTLVLEILSPSTQLTDRREKLQNYRLIDSVEEYVLAAQDLHKLTIYRRANGWRPQVCAGAEATAEFRSIGLVLPLNAVYDDILSG